MDEGVKEINNNYPWNPEVINEEDFVYRQVPVQQRISNRGKKYPSESHFILRESEDSLSFNWAKYIDVQKNFQLIGISYFRDKFLDYTAFKIFRFPVNFLKSLSKFKRVEYSPVFNGLPSPIGQPNIKSHTSLHCDAFDDAIRAELSDFCLDNYEQSYCEFDVKLVRAEIEELRARGNDTPFHMLWDFPDC